VEGVGGLAPVGGRIGERPDHFEELDDRPGPAVRDDERQRLGVRREDVEEVDAEPIDSRAELRQRV
jgi:hypothetical protein